eukprot:TRINITY_DN2015_c0_g1_i1.p1 TRINITY_DN2015_c0_g1~~TRINITY_DN2015_c0_g1_i1.p1  ORF type:complete len:132 (-),score=12.49 TRINITY_DN2015_c0_g1_i1:80-475(-)
MQTMDVKISLYCGYCNHAISDSDTKYCIRACGTIFHKECFVCQECHTRLFSFSKFFDVGGKPMCGPCYSNRKNPTCYVCRKPIDGTYTLAGPQEFKVHDGCFHCAGCGGPFDDGTGFTEDEGRFWHLLCLE